MKTIAIDEVTEFALNNATRLPSPIKVENGNVILTKNQFAKLKFATLKDETYVAALLRIAVLYS